MKPTKEKKIFSIVERMKSVTHAWRGVALIIMTGHNLWIEMFFAFLTAILGFILKISNTDWMFLILSFGLVFVAEAINTAIEIDIDLTSPEYHPYAHDTKDVAAGAVLIMSTVTLIIGLIIFLPKIFNLI
jgi:diacylglycerol kinase